MTKEEIENIVSQALVESPYFMVSFNIVQKKESLLINITLDSDSGITIDECGILNRKICSELDLVDSLAQYNVQVSSPGVGEPLKLVRQYQKNIGRDLKIVMLDGVAYIGKLIQVIGDETIVITPTPEKKRSKKDLAVAILDLNLSINQIKKATVEVSFKS